jgi:hypothetical protein
LLSAHREDSSVACPIASVAAAVATVGGARALLIQDRSFRLFTWLTLLTVAAGWWVYFIAARVPPLRISLELVTSLAAIAAVLRVRWLVRHRGIRLPMLAGITRLLRVVWSVIGSPWVLSSKVWLAAMLVMEWRGKAHFTAVEYALVCAVLVAFVVARVLSRRATRSQFSSLEAIAASGAAPACPLGFGCQVSATTPPIATAASPSFHAGDSPGRADDESAVPA